MRKGFKILAISFLALLVIAGATIGYANRPRTADRGELQALINSKVCRDVPCPVPAGSDWFKATKSGKSINIDATLELPRAGIYLKVPKSYPKGEGTVKVNLQGVLKGDPEFKLLPEPPGEEGDYLRLRPVAGLKEQIEKEWDTASVGTVRTDIALFSESLDKEEQADGRIMALKLALERGTPEQIDQDLKALNPWLEREFPAMIDLMKKAMATTKEEAVKKSIKPKLAEFEKVVRVLAENENRPRRGGGGGGQDD